MRHVVPSEPLQIILGTCELRAGRDAGMRTTEQPGQDKGVRSYVKAVWHLVISWGVRVGFVAVVSIVILAYLHIVEEPHYLLLVISGLILFLSEQLLESNRQIREQATAIESVIENISLRLYALTDCVKDLDAMLQSIRPGEKVVIEHLGLDLTQAWQYFEPLLKKHQHLTDVDYRLLLLTDETAKIAGADAGVKSWSANVPRTLDKVREDVDTINKQRGGPGQGKKIQFEVKKYWDIPVVHGFRIGSPMSRSRCYMAICRWGGSDYQRFEWGEPLYHKIIGDPSDAVSHDMLNIYDGYFNYFWKKHSDPGFVLPSPRSGANGTPSAHGSSTGR
jgi:hypothetical protein